MMPEVKFIYKHMLIAQMSCPQIECYMVDSSIRVFQPNLYINVMGIIYYDKYRSKTNI